MPPGKKNESTGKKFDRLFNYIDEIKEDITELRVGQAVIMEKLKAITSNRWTPGQWAIVLSALIGAFGAIVVAFVK